MYVLGIGQIGGFDSSVALLKDGELRMAVAEERLTRRKHLGGYPEKALKKVLEHEGIGLPDVDHIAIVDRPLLRFFWRTGEWYLPKLLKHPATSVYHILHDEIPQLLDFGRARHKLLRESKGRAKVHFVEHHAAHQASAFYASGFEDAALLSFDARGEVATTALGVGNGIDHKIQQRARHPHSLGMFYAAITDHLGFQHGNDEYKVMGLASYGNPKYLHEMRDLIRFDPDRLVVTNLEYFTYQNGHGFLSDKFSEVFGPKRGYDEPVEDQHQDIAASAQAVLEEIVISLAQHAKRTTGKNRLCMAGGVALNCVANGKVYKERIFDEIFVQPAAGDDGGALGAAYYVNHHVLRERRRFVMHTANVGPTVDDKAIERALEISKVPFRKSDNICREVAQALSEGKIVGWYQGRMEFGPRALGSRSILADPTNPNMKDLINSYVKFREEFRPFAPSCKKEAASKFFELDFPSPFMLFIVDVKEQAKGLLPAITHVDGTARVQCVAQEHEGRYWELLDEFEKLSGVPVVLNTSFNVMGEPIVDTPQDALRCFFSTGMDVLAVGDYIVYKNPDEDHLAGTIDRSPPRPKPWRPSQEIRA